MLFQWLNKFPTCHDWLHPPDSTHPTWFHSTHSTRPSNIPTQISLLIIQNPSVPTYLLDDTCHDSFPPIHWETNRASPMAIHIKHSISPSQALTTQPCPLWLGATDVQVQIQVWGSQHSCKILMINFQLWYLLNEISFLPRFLLIIFSWEWEEFFHGW